MNYIIIKMKTFLLLTKTLFILFFFFQASETLAQQDIFTDKNNYQQNESITVSFTNAPGNSGDWICISPKDSSDNVAGDYQYIPRGVKQGKLTFTIASPGHYEARAYYRYSSKGYVVSARHEFLVGNASNTPVSSEPSSANNNGQGSDFGIGYFMSELSGSAKPEGGVDKSIPVQKKYKVSQAVLWTTVQDVLENDGYFFSADSASGRIKTDPKVLGDQNHVAMFGATYSAVAMIKVRGSSVSFRARFNKQSNVVMGGSLLEFPEKENELRQQFFKSLDAELSQVM
jgi:hypothetical protein